MIKKEVVIVAAKRTAIGNFNGAFANVPAYFLGSCVIETLLSDTLLRGDEISEIILGQVLTANCGQNPARQAALAGGVAKSVPAYGINQVCGSGLKAVMIGAANILSNNANIVIAGGQENMSQAPHAIHLRSATKMGNATIIDTMLKDGLWDVFGDYHMGITAENIAKQFNISRMEQDEFAVLSQQKAAQAQRQKLFLHEIIPVKIKDRKGDIIVDSDEFIRTDTNIESLTKLRPAFATDGTVTAGNSSGINDGAAAIVMMSLEEAHKRNLKPLAKIKSFAQTGVEPNIMGTGPISASRKALEKANWKVSDLDIIEANEAFAAQAIAVNREVGWDLSKVNINGGAIALGHPIGASGTRILVTLLHSMQYRQAKKGLATLCVGGGMGVAICVERS